MEILVERNSKMSKLLIDQYHCHYEVLEEYHAGMWRSVKGKDLNKNHSRAFSLMSDLERFSLAMDRVCDEWPNSCKKNFTDPTINPVAWLGQAAVCLDQGVSEGYTRISWSALPMETQVKACAIAKEKIDAWREEYVGQGGLFDVKI